MTGKELLLFLLGTGLAAGAGGVGAAVVMDGGAQASDLDSEVLARLDDLRAAIDDTNEGLSGNRTALRRMERRVQQFEIDLAETGKRVASGALVAPDGGDVRRGTITDPHTGRIVRTLGDGGLSTGLIESTDVDATQQALAKAMETMSERLSGIRLGEGGDGRLAVALGGLTKGLELRKLPEEERWQKARDEIGLNEVQIDEIKAAIAERDAAVEQSMNVDRDEDTGDARVRVRSLDFTKAREANEAYRERVDNTLNEQQRKDWREQGYDRAFGKSGLGFSTGTVISVSSFSEGSDASESSEER